MEPVEVLGAEEVFARYSGSPAGLTSAEAARRLGRDGPNELPEPPRPSTIVRLLRELVHFMALLLWVAGALAFVSGMPELGWAIWAVIVINAGFSFWQEHKAERALRALAHVLPQTTRVVRDGAVRTIPARELVVGDLLQIEEGDRVSADARLVQAAQLRVDLSLLTGESVPVDRTADPAPAPAPATAPADAPNRLLAGTTVVAGRGRAVVTATGPRTAFGEVARLTASVQRGASTLEREVRRLVRLITLVAVGMGIVVFALGHLFVAIPLHDNFLFAIGIIVANVPEGLLPSVSLSLALGVQRMAARNALVRRLSSVETLSGATVILTDKTGTLTQNAMSVREAWVPGARAILTGEGYAPGGEVRVAHGGEGEARLALLLQAAALCTNARLTTRNGEVVCDGDPTEGALLAAAQKLGPGRDPASVTALAPRVAEAPFDAERRMMSVVVRDAAPFAALPYGPAATEAHAPPRVVISKGAPLDVLARSTRVVARPGVRPLDEATRAAVRDETDRLAAHGLRVLGVAARRADPSQISLDNNQDGASRDALERDLVFLGLVAMLDPPRPEVPEAVTRCRTARLRVIMVTGDQGATALAIARQVGIVAPEEPARVVTGAELDALDDAALAALLGAPGALLFARTAPAHKLRLVRAFRQRGDVVAVTGDGVNDAPALRAADIGLAMGRGGTDVAREAADVVLVDDCFATVASAVEEGRTIYANLRKFLAYILSSNIPELFPFIAMLALGIPPALNILQILAVDLGTDMLPALALGAEPPEPGLMTRPPRAAASRLLDKKLLLRAYGFLGVLEGIAAMAAFAWVFWRAGWTLDMLRAAAPALLSGSAAPDVEALYRRATTVTLIAIVACQIGNVFACRSEHLTARALGWRTNPRIWIGIAVEIVFVSAIAWLPPVARVFRAAAPSLGDVAPVALYPLLMILADTLWKRARLSAASTARSGTPAPRSIRSR
jgi:Ca2+-transporting ATPase